MGLYKRKDSPIWWMSFCTSKRQYQKSTGTDDKKLAERIHDSVKGRIALGQWIPEVEEKRQHTFPELVEKYSLWAAGRQKGWKRSAACRVKQLDKYFGSYELSCIDTNAVEQFQTDETSRGLDPASVNRIMTILKHMFAKALDWDMINERGHKKVLKVKQLKGATERLRYLSIEEAMTLIASCEPHLNPVVQFALNTGCRRGEILNLTWDRVDLRHRFILMDNNTKGGKRRELPIGETLWGVLQGLVRRLNIPYVFFDNETGKPYGDVKRSFHTALRRAGITDFRFHDLRHTFASNFVMGGGDIHTLQQLLGHKDIKMTMRYAHLAPTHLVEAVRKFDAVFNAKNKLGGPVLRSFSEGAKAASYDDSMTLGVERKLAAV